jgi:hypothetical protein
MEFYSFRWGANQLCVRSDTGERKTIDKPLPILVGVGAGANKADATALFVKYVGEWVGKTISDRDLSPIVEHIFTRPETGGQRELQKVIDAVQEDLGTISLVSTVAWFTQHDNDAEGHVPVVRLRITAKEGDKVRVLNVRGEDDDGIIIDDPLDLADAVTTLF